MLTKKTKAIIDIYVMCGTFLGCHPMRWESPAKKKLIVSRKTPWMWYIYTGVIFLYGCFVNWRLFESLFILGEPIEKTVIQMFYAISYVFYWGTNSSYLFRRHQIAEFVNCIISFDKKFESTETIQIEVRQIERRVIMIALACAGRFIFEGPCFLVFSGNRNFIFSVVLPYIAKQDHLFLYKLPFALLELILSAYAWTCSLFHTIFFIIFTNSVPVWCKEMQYQVVKKNERPVQRRIFYRSIQILMNMFNDCYQNLAFLWVKVTCCIGMIICLYGTLRFYGKIGLLGYLCLPSSCVLGTLYIYLIFPKAAETSDSLQKTSNTWKLINVEVIRKSLQIRTVINDLGQPNIRHAHYIRGFDHVEYSRLKHRRTNILLSTNALRSCKIKKAFNRSCPFIGINVSTFYVVGRASTLIFCDFVINQTINLLMAV